MTTHGLHQRPVWHPLAFGHGHECAGRELFRGQAAAARSGFPFVWGHHVMGTPRGYKFFVKISACRQPPRARNGKIKGRCAKFGTGSAFVLLMNDSPNGRVFMERVEREYPAMGQVVPLAVPRRLGATAQRPGRQLRRPGRVGSRIGRVSFGALGALGSARACGSRRTSGTSWPSRTCCAGRARLTDRAGVAFFTFGAGRAWRSRWPLEAAAKG